MADATIHWKASRYDGSGRRTDVPACNYTRKGELTEDWRRITCNAPACARERRAGERQEKQAGRTVHGLDGSMFQIVTPEGASTARLLIRDAATGRVTEFGGLDFFDLDKLASAAAFARQTLIARDPEGFERALDEARTADAMRRAEEKVRAEIEARKAEDAS